MEFKNLFSKKILIVSLFAVFVIVLFLWKFILKSDSSSIPESDENLPSSQVEPIKETSVRTITQSSSVKDEALRVPKLDISQEDDAMLQRQLDHDREEQRQTKYLRTKLEQTNLELEQEKAFAEINKIRMENTGAFKETALEGQNNLPEVRVEYIGGDSMKKEAILSIAGTSFQVKEKSNPTDNIQVVSISDSSVTLHFSAPQELTKIINYKPE